MSEQQAQCPKCGCSYLWLNVSIRRHWRRSWPWMTSYGGEVRCKRCNWRGAEMDLVWTKVPRQKGFRHFIVRWFS